MIDKPATHHGKANADAPGLCRAERREHILHQRFGSSCAMVLIATMDTTILATWTKTRIGTWREKR